MATFSALPYELRALIWEMMVDPRTVNVEFKYRRHYSGRFPRLTSSTPVPAVLQVCREARNYGPRLYQKAFSEMASPGKGLQYVWVNLEIDIIDIGKSLLEHFQPVAHKIRRLRLEREISSEFFFYSEINELGNFDNVQEIHIVCADGLYAWVGELEEHFWPCGKENVFLIDPEDHERSFKGPEGEKMIARMHMEEIQDWTIYDPEWLQ